MKTTRFDVADYLETHKSRVEYLAAARETRDPEFIRDAYKLVARARNKSKQRGDTVVGEP